MHDGEINIHGGEQNIIEDEIDAQQDAELHQ